MSESTYQRAAQIFAEVCALGPGERGEALARLCAGDAELLAEVESLLEADARPGPFLEGPALGPLDMSLEAIEPRLPERIGRYRVVRLLGQGGAATVFEARQQGPDRSVAVKVLRFGWSRESRARFANESRVLAALRHPAIADIYETGVSTHAGIELPYIAMQLVAGKPVTEHARDLPRECRIALFLQVCDGVSHAHQRGVIHRDLKPGNILVGEDGHAKILDFGIARLLDEREWAFTIAGQPLGTPGSMAPEQLAGGETDTRTDVYSLGVLLFEMLGGRPPFDLDGVPLAAAIGAIRSGPTPRLGALDPSLRGDLDLIVAKAMSPEPERRYSTAGELAEDIRRARRHEVILARPPSAGYQVRRFAQRHPALGSAAAVFLVMLVAVSIVSASLALHAQSHRRRAEQLQTEAESVSGFLLDLFLGTPDVDQISRLELLLRADRRLLLEPPSNPRVEAAIREYLGHGYLKLLETQRAAPHLARAVEIRRGLGTIDDDFVESLTLLGMQRVAEGDIAAASALFREALARRRTLYGAEHILTRPPGELLYFARLYAPDEPEIALEREHTDEVARRASVPGEPPGEFAGEPVLSDDFDSDTLDSGWSVELENLREWTREEGAARLGVASVEAAESGAALIRFARRLPPAGDFRAQCRLGWEGESPLCIQSAGLQLVGPARETIAYAYYTDGWIAARGGRSARVGADEVSAVYAVTGGDTLPDRGEALVTIERRDGFVSIWWNGEEMLRGESDLPLAEVHLVVTHHQHENYHGRSTFGGVWFDGLRVLAPARE